nr:DUF4349 domain-containing protein [uncultured Chryseobacterium sp.]
MKKYLLLLTAAGIFTMCKKGDASTSTAQNPVNPADSNAVNVEDKANETAQDAGVVFDSAAIRIKNFDKTSNEVTEKIESTSRSVDSLSDKIAHMRLESKIEKKDSLQKNSEKIIVNVAAPKVIRETKVIYKDKPKSNHQSVVSKNKMYKTGLLELNVKDAETAKEIVEEQVKKYDGFIKSENISLNNNDKKTAYLKVKIPIQKFDYLMEDLSYTIGEVINKGVDITGQDFENNTLCDVEITLYGDSQNITATNKPEGFGEQSLAAVSSGWNVITSIFLFILPLWPLFLIAGTGYYFYKKKNRSLPKS